MIDFINYLQEMNPYIYLELFALVLPAYLYITRRFYFNIFDPLATYIVMNSFAICLVMYMFIFNDIKITSFILFIANNILFWVGFAIVYNRYRDKYTKRLKLVLDMVSSNKSHFATVVLSFITILVSVLLFASRGVPILSENPSDAKVLLYEGGFGPVRYIHMNFIPIVIGLCVIGAVLVTYKSKSKKLFQISNLRYFVVLVWIILLLITMGSKGSLLSILTFLSMVLFYLKICNERKIYHKIIVISYITFLFAVAYLVLVAFLTTSESYDVLSHIIVRFVAAGDVFFFYFKYNLSDYYINHNLIDYMLYIINPVASIIRIAEPGLPMGAELLHHATGWPLTSFGPNAQFPVIGDIFFGETFSWLYSVILGMLVGFLRVGSIKYLFRCGTYGSVLYVFLWGAAITIPTDLILFIQLTFMFLLFSTPVYIFAHVVGRISNSKSCVSLVVSNCKSACP